MGMIMYRKGKMLDKSILNVTGFETRRKDTPDFFKEQLTKAYEIILTQDYDTVKAFIRKVKEDIKTQPPQSLAIRLTLSQHSTKYTTNIPMHVRALRNSGIELRRGDNVEMLYVKGSKEVEHYVEGKKYDIDYDLYYKKFFERKIELVDKELYEKLFNTQVRLSSWLA